MKVRSDGSLALQGPSHPLWPNAAARGARTKVFRAQASTLEEFADSYLVKLGGL